MPEFRFERIRLEHVPRTAPSRPLPDAELRQVEADLRRALDDPMRARGLARFVDATVFFSPDHLLELVMEQLRMGRISVEREPDPQVDPGAGLDAATLARFAGEEDLADEEHAVAIELVGEDDAPIAGVRYRITLPDGRVMTGRSDAQGRALFWGLPAAGDCTIEFPDLDSEAWESVSSEPL